MSKTAFSKRLQTEFDGFFEADLGPVTSAGLTEKTSPSPYRLGVAVSGGSDSLATLVLATDMAARLGHRLSCVTVDHKLRSEAPAEAQAVAKICNTLGVSHDILEWNDWDGQGNLQGQARQARYDLIAQWARSLNLDAVLLGHTKDDLAETFLMRLARGSGLDGLSAMTDRFYHDDQLFCRPVLTMARADLRDALTAQKINWIEDPSNQDDRFDRIKIRKSMPVLAELGIDTDRLITTAQNLAQSRDAIQNTVARWWSGHVLTTSAGALQIARDAFDTLPSDFQRRVLLGCIAVISGKPYPPRADAVQHLAKAVHANQRITLAGCIFHTQASSIECVREVNAMPDSTDLTEIYDTRWDISGPTLADAMIRPLGEKGLLNCQDWRKTGHSRLALMATPSIWQSENLIAAPIAGLPGRYTCQLLRDHHDFLTAIGTH